MEQNSTVPSLVASTSDSYCCSIRESKRREGRLEGAQPPAHDATDPADVNDEELDTNYFKSAQWSPDGTSLLTSSADNTIRTFILPPTLLDDPSSQIALMPYTSHTHPTAINCLTTYPLFNLSDPTTTLYLSAPIDLPIRLTNALSPTPTPISSYALISPTTEAYYTPSSVLWSSPNHFVAGTDCLIALFDVSRNGQGPVIRMPTIPSKRHKMKGGGVGMRGIVSALSLQPSANEQPGMLAAGTWTRWVGLYDMGGMGGTVATWTIANAADKDAGIGGAGVTHTGWSACGRYLFVAERKSRGILVYDVRVTGKLICWLEGREAETNQRLGVDVFEDGKGMEIWAGGTDGIVRVWSDIGMAEGAQGRSWEWRAHDDPVTSAVMHSSGTVVATCSGQRAVPSLGEDENDDEGVEEQSSDGEEQSSRHSFKPPSRTPDNSIKVWSL